MNSNDIINKALEDNNGIVKINQITKKNISKSTFYAYVKKHDLEKIAHGIYAKKNSWIDSMHILYLRSSKIVFSHETALYFHDLTDREPIKYDITINTGYNPTIFKNEGIKTYTVKEELLSTGLIKMNTNFGNEVAVYDKERTICDITRSKKNIEPYIYQNALKQYLNSSDCDLVKLMGYAKLFNVHTILSNYLEVLL